jgi:hypothetical protein
VVFIVVDYFAATFGICVAATRGSSELRGMSVVAVSPEMLHLIWMKPGCVMEASLRRKSGGVKPIPASLKICRNQPATWLAGGKDGRSVFNSIQEIEWYLNPTWK